MSLGRFTVCNKKDRDQFDKEINSINKENNNEFQRGIIKHIVKCKYKNNMLNTINNKEFFASFVLDQKFKIKNPDFKFVNNKIYICHITENGYLINCELFIK